MKYVMIFVIFASFFTGTVSAFETNTECPYMRESNERNNPKANLSNIKLKANKQKSGAVRQ